MRLLVLCLTLSIASPAQSAGEPEVRAALNEFFTAFNNLDWPRFRQCWSQSPSLFIPTVIGPAAGKRAEGEAAFEATWLAQFESIRKTVAARGVTKAPYMSLSPRELRIDLPSATVAIATMHLSLAGDSFGRRTFVLARIDGRWKITHLHASNLSLK